MTARLDDIRMVQNGDATVAYAVAGPTDPAAPVLCLIASTGRGPEDFAHLADALAAGGLRVVLPWPRGLGKSTGPLDGIDFHDLAADAGAALAAEQGTGAAVVVGHAYGCWIARTLAHDRPDLVDGIILLAAGAGKWADDLSRAIEIAMTPEEPRADRLAALQYAFFAPGNDPEPWLDGWSGPLVKAQRAARARTDPDSWRPSGRAPILDVIGRQDPFRPAEALDTFVTEFAPRVTLKPVDGASHALPDEKPAEVAAAILDWIAQLPANGQAGSVRNADSSKASFS